MLHGQSHRLTQHVHSNRPVAECPAQGCSSTAPTPTARLLVPAPPMPVLTLRILLRLGSFPEHLSDPSNTAYVISPTVARKKEPVNYQPPDL